jgi:hypothetical protein
MWQCGLKPKFRTPVSPTPDFYIQIPTLPVFEGQSNRTLRHGYTLLQAILPRPGICLLRISENMLPFSAYR